MHVRECVRPRLTVWADQDHPHPLSMADVRLHTVTEQINVQHTQERQLRRMKEGGEGKKGAGLTR